jgi:hypothetical protein
MLTAVLVRKLIYKSEYNFLLSNMSFETMVIEDDSEYNSRSLQCQGRVYETSQSPNDSQTHPKFKGSKYLDFFVPVFK